jgi:hypothetical protein
MIVKLRKLRFELKEMLIKLYLDNCRTEHNVAFFQWRQNFKTEAEEFIPKYTQKLMMSIHKDDKMLGHEEKEGKSHHIMFRVQQ